MGLSKNLSISKGSWQEAHDWTKFALWACPSSISPVSTEASGPEGSETCFGRAGVVLGVAFPMKALCLFFIFAMRAAFFLAARSFLACAWLDWLA